jgi:hypothetical protein
MKTPRSRQALNDQYVLVVAEVAEVLVALVAVVPVDEVPVVEVAVVVIAVVSVTVVLAPVDETPVSVDAVSVLALLSFLHPSANADTSNSAHIAATNDLFIRGTPSKVTRKPGRMSVEPLGEGL